MASTAILDQKKQVVEEIKAKISAASSIVLVDYKGLTVAQDTELRNRYRAAGVEYKVLKNRLVKIAFKELGYNQFEKFLDGPTAVAFGGADSMAPAKITVESAKAFTKLSAKCGMVDGTFFDEQGIKAVALLPSREVLLSKMLGSLLAPISKFAYVLSAIKDQRSASAE